MKALSLMLVLALAACASDPGETPTPPIATPAPRPPAVRPSDTCGASALQGLVGRPRSEIPVPVRPELQRVACTTCPVTMDFNQNRLNFFFDTDTGAIREVRCG